MASIQSATNLSSVLASLSETLDQFRSESAEIESKFFELVDGIAGHCPSTASPSTASVAIADEPVVIESIAVERLEDLDRSIARQREEFTGKQDQLSDDVGELRDLVDQQVRLFAAWIESTTTPKTSNASRKVKRKKTSEDDVINEVSEQIDGLREVGASIRETASA